MQHRHRFIIRPAIVTIVMLVALACLAPHPASGAPIIQEVFYDASRPDAAEAFTEIFGPAGMLLDGWSLVGINGGTGLNYRTLDLSGAVIPADGLLLVATDSATPARASLCDFVGSIDWQNGPDAVQLIDPFAVVIDALQYGDAGPSNLGSDYPRQMPRPVQADRETCLGRIRETTSSILLSVHLHQELVPPRSPRYRFRNLRRWCFSRAAWSRSRSEVAADNPGRSSYVRRPDSWVQDPCLQKG